MRPAFRSVPHLELLVILCSLATTPLIAALEDPSAEQATKLQTKHKMELRYESGCPDGTCECSSGWQPHCQAACCNPWKAKKAPACKPAHGSVGSKDDTAKSFVVHPKTGADATFMTNDKTSYWKGKKKSDWATLAVGDNAHVTCTMDGTNMVAKTVKFTTPKPAKPAAK